MENNGRKEYDKTLSIRIPNNLRIHEEMGFSSMAEFVKKALEEYIQHHNFEVARTSAILDLMGDMILGMETIRDYDADRWNPEKEQLVDSLYTAAKKLASTDIMQNAPVNILDSLGEDGKIEGKIYKYQWAM